MDTWKDILQELALQTGLLVLTKVKEHVERKNNMSAGKIGTVNTDSNYPAVLSPSELAGIKDPSGSRSR